MGQRRWQGIMLAKFKSMGDQIVKMKSYFAALQNVCVLQSDSRNGF
jgi:hypothetical protein